MKLGVLAASTLIGVASLSTASFSQEHMSRSSRTDVESAMEQRSAATGPASVLESARPAAGMLPTQPMLPGRPYHAEGSMTPAQSTDLRQFLRE